MCEQVGAEVIAAPMTEGGSARVQRVKVRSRVFALGRPPEQWIGCEFPHFILFDRRSTAVKAFIRTLFLAFVTMSLLGVTGCGVDNETEAQKLGSKSGDPGKPNPGSLNKEDIPPPKGREEAAKRQKEQQDKQFQKGYQTGEQKG